MPFTNMDVMNTIRANASPSYQERIPLVTANNLHDTANAILEYKDFYNEFVNVLINKIAMTIVQKLAYKNPFAQFKKGMMPQGAYIEQLFVEIAQATDRNYTSDNALYARVIPDVSVIFHTINREDYYKTTIQFEILKRAFNNVNGLNDLTTQIVQSLFNGDETDEFLIMKNQLSDYYTRNLFYPVSIPAPIDHDTAEDCVVALRTMSYNLTFMNNGYNSMGVTTVTPLNRQVYFVRTDFEATVGVKVLSHAFQLSEADYIARRILVDDFGANTENVMCMLTDEDFFVQYDTTYRNETLYNPEKLYWNIWLHHYGIYSTNRFANAVVFVKNDVSATGVIVTGNTTVNVGTTSRYTSEVTGTAGTYIPQSVTWKIDSVVTDSFIDRSGVLHVGTNESATTITISATSNFNKNTFGVLDVTVAGAVSPQVTGIAITPTSLTGVKGEEYQFTGTVTGNTVLTDFRVRYQINGAPTDSWISNTGLLVVGANETVTSFGVVATSMFDPTYSVTSTVTVTNPTP